jgi:hypothetical protein
VSGNNGVDHTSKTIVASIFRDVTIIVVDLLSPQKLSVLDSADAAPQRTQRFTKDGRVEVVFFKTCGASMFGSYEIILIALALFSY